MEWLTLESYLMMSWQSSLLNQALYNINYRCLYIISMYQMEQQFLCYLMLMIVSIGIHMKILENGLWKTQERYSMWTSWDMHIGLCKSGFLRLRTITFSVDQDIYNTSILAKYLDTYISKKSTKFYETTLPSDIIFTKDNVPISDYQVDNLTRELNINYRSCIGPFTWLLSTRVYLIFPLHKLEKFSSYTGKVYFEGLVNLLI